MLTESDLSKLIRRIISEAEEEDPPVKSKMNMFDLARSVIGTPYKWGGQSTSGFDCSGFVRWVYKNSGKFNDASGNLDKEKYKKFPGHAPGQLKLVTKVNFNGARPGDLVFFKSDPTFNDAGHVGIVTNKSADNFDMIHASSRRGIVEDKNVIKGKNSDGSFNTYNGPIISFGRYE